MISCIQSGIPFFGIDIITRRKTVNGHRTNDSSHILLWGDGMLRLVHPEDIETYYNDQILNEDRAVGIIRALRARDLYAISVQRLDNGRYILTSGFIAYAAYLRTLPRTFIPVIELPSTNHQERIINILMIAINLEKETSWLFKNEHIMMLIDDYGMNEREIANATNQTISKINSYILDRRIPPNIRAVVAERSAKTVVQSICRSTVIPENMKDILYTRAILIAGNPLRCDGRKLRLLIEFLSEVKNDIPSEILSSENRLVQFIDFILINNFNLTEHWSNFLEDTIEKILS